MATFIDHDVATVWKNPTGGRGDGNVLAVLYRGDEVTVLQQKGGATHVALGVGREGWVRGNLRVRAAGLLELAFIDVGQGDACLVTTPNRYRLLVDGGENNLAGRYLAARFWDATRAGRDVLFDGIVVTHGDADHFEGLSSLVLDAASESRDRKRIRIATKRIFHNGLVKRPTGRAARRPLGPLVNVGDQPFIPVVDDPRTVSDPNRPFKRWQKALDELENRHPFTVVQLDASRRDAFSFLDDVEVAVLGPHGVVLPDGRVALALLNAEGGRSPSAARTINGHSIALRFTLGNVSALLTGDLHAKAEEELVRLHRQGELSLRAEVLKVPHHGSDDVSRDFVNGVQPVVSIISAGDEDARRDYLHPRANLLGMLGRANRGADPVIFVTNLAAFDEWAGPAFHAVRKGDDWMPDVATGVFNARERTAYGIIHVRTDGSRLLVVRRGARCQRCEAYSYQIEVDGTVHSLEIDRV